MSESAIDRFLENVVELAKVVDSLGELDEPEMFRKDLAAAKKEVRELRRGAQTAYVLFDGPPGPESGRFIEVENEAGHSIKAGEWVQRGNLWALKVKLLLPGSQ